MIYKDNPYEGVTNPKRVVIDLSSDRTNSANLLFNAARWCVERGLRNGSTILKEMSKSDFENLIKVFDKYFGDFADLVNYDKKNNNTCDDSQR